MRVCIVGASGKLGQYMVRHALDRGYEVVGVCREESVEKLNAFKGRITVVPGATNDAEVIKRAVSGCDGVLVVLVPRGVHGYSTGTAQAVLDDAPQGARLVFSCGWHIRRDGQDVYSWKLKAIVKVFGPLARLARFADLDDQVEACRRVFASDTRWTVVRGSDLEEGESQGLPVWSRHVGDPILESNITRPVDFALFMVAAIENDELVQEAPAIVGCRTPSALAHKSLVAAQPPTGDHQRPPREAPIRSCQPPLMLSPISRCQPRQQTIKPTRLPLGPLLTTFLFVKPRLSPGSHCWYWRFWRQSPISAFSTSSSLPVMRKLRLKISQLLRGYFVSASPCSSWWPFSTWWSPGDSISSSNRSTGACHSWPRYSGLCTPPCLASPSPIC